MVKICGLRTPADARACQAAGASLLGLNLVPSSRRFVDPDRALLVRGEPGAATPVLVHRDASPDRVLADARALGVTWVQLHGDESAAHCADLRALGHRVIKALSFTGDGDALARLARSYAGSVDALLIDAPRPGSGEPWAWHELARLPLPRPFLLAGGLTPDTVAAAVAAARPDGVDVASGVEVGGQMSAPLIAAFVREASLALDRLGPRHPWPSTITTP